MKNVKPPNWYDYAFYNKKRSPEEWLCEIDKRYKFKRDKINLIDQFNQLAQKNQEDFFCKKLFSQHTDNVLDILKTISRQPIKYLSVSDIILMYHYLVNSSWYKNHPKRLTIENAISKSLNNGILTGKQKEILMEMHDTPWCIFNENYQKASWSPNQDIPFLTGIPISLDVFHLKDDICSDLKNKLAGWNGKPHVFISKLDTWDECKILAVFDLMMWFEIKQIKSTKKDLYDLIWPKGRISKTRGEYVEPNGAIKNSIKLANEAINPSVIKLLVMICEDRKQKMQG